MSLLVPVYTMVKTLLHLGRRHGMMVTTYPQCRSTEFKPVIPTKKRKKNSSTKGKKVQGNCVN